MWTSKQTQPVRSGAPPQLKQKLPAPPSAKAVSAPAEISAVRTPAHLGRGIVIRGEITGHEDLHVDGLVEGPISLGGHRLTVGRSGRVDAEVVAREVVVYGELQGDFRVRDLVEIKKDSSVTGDVSTARIVIEEGAYFRGKIDIDRSGQVGADLDALLSRADRRAE